MAADETSGEMAEWTAWLTEGLGVKDAVYCLTVLQDMAPDEALRRFGAPPDNVFTATWPELLDRSEAALAQEAEAVGKPAYQLAWGHCAVVAFALGAHTLLVEDNGCEGIDSAAWSEGTLAVSTYQSVNADVHFAVSRDGVVLAELDENAPSYASGADVGVLAAPLAAMGITDPVAFDADEDNYHALDVIQLLCRIGGIRPTVDQMRRPALAAIFRKPK